MSEMICVQLDSLFLESIFKGDLPSTLNERFEKIREYFGGKPDLLVSGKK